MPRPVAARRVLRAVEMTHSRDEFHCWLSIIEALTKSLGERNARSIRPVTPVAAAATISRSSRVMSSREIVPPWRRMTIARSRISPPFEDGR